MSDLNPNLHQIKLNGQNVTYWDTGGPKNAQTYLLIHGFRGNHRGLLPLASHLNAGRIIIPDLPGHGHTDPLPKIHNTPSYTSFVKDFIATLGLTNLILIGHSFGTLPALAYAASPQNQVKKLILISPIPKASAGNYVALPYYLIGQLLPGALRKQWLSLRAIQSPVRRLIINTPDRTLIKQLMDEGEIELRELQPNVIIEAYKSIVRADPNDWLHHISAPTLVVTGTKDILTPIRKNIAAYRGKRNITFIPVPNMGHYGHFEMAAEVATICNRWLTQTSNPATKEIS